LFFPKLWTVKLFQAGLVASEEVVEEVDVDKKIALGLNF